MIFRQELVHCHINFNSAQGERNGIIRFRAISLRLLSDTNEQVGETVPRAWECSVRHALMADAEGGIAPQ